MRRMLSGAVRGALLGAIVMLSGCVTSQAVSGPDGAPAVVFSGSSAASCYAEAGKRCPDGYLIHTARQTGLDFTLLVRCRTSAPPPAVAPAVAPPPDKATTAVEE
jgi:hypothetical protein